MKQPEFIKNEHLQGSGHTEVFGVSQVFIVVSISMENPDAKNHCFWSRTCGRWSFLHI